MKVSLGFNFASFHLAVPGVVVAAIVVGRDDAVPNLLYTSIMQLRGKPMKHPVW